MIWPIEVQHHQLIIHQSNSTSDSDSDSQISDQADHQPILDGHHHHPQTNSSNNILQNLSSPFTLDLTIRSDTWTPIIGGLHPSQSLQTNTSIITPTSPAPPQSTSPNLVSLFDSVDPSSIQSNDDDLISDLVLPIHQKLDIYVQCFQDMLSLVLQREQYLFSEPELNLFKSWNQLPYPSRYLFVRLFMRKHSQWFRLDKLTNYQTEVGDLHQACLGLCQPVQDLSHQAFDITPTSSTHPLQDLSIPSNSSPASKSQSTSHQVLTSHSSPPSQPSSPLPSSHHPTPSEFEITRNQSRHHTPLSSDSLLSTNPLSLNITQHRSRLPHPLTQPNALGLNITDDDGLRTQNMPSSLQQVLILCGVVPSHHLDPYLPDLASSDLPPIPSPVPIPAHVKHKRARPEKVPDGLEAFASMTNMDPDLLSGEELCACLSLPELKTLARQFKTNPHTTRDMIIRGLMDATKGQSTLARSGKRLGLHFNARGLKERQSSVLSRKILLMIGHCIKLSPQVCALFARLHLVFYRSRAINERSMTAAVLARFQLRAYPRYHVLRSEAIFPSRSALIRYEKALEMEREMDECLMTSVEELRTTQRGGILDPVEEKQRRRTAKDARMRRGHEILMIAYEEWKSAVKEADERLTQKCHGVMTEEDERYNYYLKQFHPAHPFTRIVSKGAEIQAYFKNYEAETELLAALLRQTHFRRGKRGAWYDRLALVMMTHLASGSGSEEAKLKYREMAYTLCEEGLQDQYTHEVYRLALQRRRLRLKNMLDIPLLSSERELLQRPVRAFPHRRITGERLGDTREVGRKSVWRGIEHGAELSVEELVLEHYYHHHASWRGFHSESGILKMLYAMIFWDVLFAPVPGAFETEFQSAPLDLNSDAFAIVRAPLIEERLRLIEVKGRDEIVGRIRETYEREASRQTWCVGVNWGKYGMEELMEIGECLGSKALVVLLKVLSEQWGYRSGGVPDLCLWNFEEKRVKFVEVKGPGDKLSETQMLWLDLLMSNMGVEIEVCEVSEGVSTL